MKVNHKLLETIILLLWWTLDPSSVSLHLVETYFYSQRPHKDHRTILNSQKHRAKIAKEPTTRRRWRPSRDNIYNFSGASQFIWVPLLLSVSFSDFCQSVCHLRKRIIRLASKSSPSKRIQTKKKKQYKKPKKKLANANLISHFNTQQPPLTHHHHQWRERWPYGE